MTLEVSFCVWLFSTSDLKKSRDFIFEELWRLFISSFLLDVDVKVACWNWKNYKSRPIQVMWFNSLVVSRQNQPIMSILTNFTLRSWKDFDVGLSLIGSKEMIWKTSLSTYSTCYTVKLKSHLLALTLATVWRQLHPLATKTIKNKALVINKKWDENFYLGKF